MSKIIQAFKENAKEEHWLSKKSEKAVRDKVWLTSNLSKRIRCRLNF